MSLEQQLLRGLLIQAHQLPLRLRRLGLGELLAADRALLVVSRALLVVARDAALPQRERGGDGQHEAHGEQAADQPHAAAPAAARAALDEPRLAAIEQ